MAACGAGGLVQEHNSRTNDHWSLACNFVKSGLLPARARDIKWIHVCVGVTRSTGRTPYPLGQLRDRLLDAKVSQREIRKDSRSVLCSSL